jgi:hypothetical protein
VTQQDIVLRDLHRRFYEGSLAQAAWSAGVWEDSEALVRDGLRTLLATQMWLCPDDVRRLLGSGRLTDAAMKACVDDWLHYCGLIEIAVEVGYVHVESPPDYWYWMKPRLRADVAELTRASERPLAAGLRFRLWGKADQPQLYLRTGAVEEWMFMNFLWLSDEMRPSGAVARLTHMLASMTYESRRQRSEIVSRPSELAQELLKGVTEAESSKLYQTLIIVDAGLAVIVDAADLFSGAVGSPVFQDLLRYHWSYQLQYLGEWSEYLKALATGLGGASALVENEDVPLVEKHVEKLKSAIAVCTENISHPAYA